MQRPAKPFTPVRFRIQPPVFVCLVCFNKVKTYNNVLKLIVVNREIVKLSPSGGIGRHKGLKIPR